LKGAGYIRPVHVGCKHGRITGVFMSQTASPLSRRRLFAGAATVGTAAAAATLLPAVRQTAEAPPALKEPPTRGGGYQLSEHIRQYYKTTLV
jgi:hypothetical protein